MNARLIPLCATVGALFVATPALAQGPAVPDAAEAAAEALPPLPGSQPMPTVPMPTVPMHGMPGPMPGVPMAGFPLAHGPTAASYPPQYQQARENWIAECADRYHSGERRDGNGGVIGGLLGAVVGGAVGNRVDKKGSRLAGTLIGAGAGGIAGAVIGSAIDRNNQRGADDEAAAWCEDYLARNTAQSGYGQAGYGYPGYGYAYPVAYAMPMMAMMPVMVPVTRCHTHEVVETIVEKPIYKTVVVRDKRVRMQPVKTVKYAKSGKYVK